jgi:murein DD-endopeptidase MepM/ murein hydrolase activator NlpD
MNRLALSFLAFLALSSPGGAFAASIVFAPERPIQGEPLMIKIEGLSSTTTVTEIAFDSKKLGIASYNKAPVAFYGIDLGKKPGTYKARARLSDGSALEADIAIGVRRKIEAPLGIPEKLGGNTATSAAKLVDTLALENASLLNLRTGTHAFWTKPFQYPVKDPVVTDEYGYSRQTVGRSITHKGTDFRAKEGTPILAMNRGVVRVAREGRNYGKTIVVDHGLGLQTFYMHLSRIDVNVGELVLPGQTIGLSGSTGYAESPHLHLTVRLNDVSIDPMVFLGFFK